MMIRRAAAALIAALALLGAVAGSASAGPPHLKHVFVIVLENENAADSFGPQSPAPYLSQTLRSKGAFLPNYYATGHESLDNYISMVSGQGPNAETQSDCQFYTDFLPGIPTSNGQYIGQGCVYPAGVETIGNQLESSGHTWRGYMEDMGTACRHPALNSHDSTQTAKVGDQYAARHNPFVYFHSITDFPTCAQNDVDYSHLASDLRLAATTPNYAMITPNLCDDGHDAPCVDGRPGGLVTANRWLKDNVPPILNSPGFKDHGLLVITFDEADAGPGPGADASACCGEASGPNTINPGGPTVGPGGGRVGAVLLSPCIRPGTVVGTAYNHYSMLRTIERNFDLPYLGFARRPDPGAIGSTTLNRSSCR